MQQREGFAWGLAAVFLCLLLMTSLLRSSAKAVGTEPRKAKTPEQAMRGHWRCDLLHGPGDSMKTALELFVDDRRLITRNTDRISHYHTYNISESDPEAFTLKIHVSSTEKKFDADELLSFSGDRRTLIKVWRMGDMMICEQYTFVDDLQEP